MLDTEDVCLEEGVDAEGEGECVWFFKNDDEQLVGFDGGDGCFYVLNEESDGWFLDKSQCFVGVEDATVTGMN